MWLCTEPPSILALLAKCTAPCTVGLEAPAAHRPCTAASQPNVVLQHLRQHLIKFTACSGIDMQRQIETAHIYMHDLAETLKQWRLISLLCACSIRFLARLMSSLVPTGVTVWDRVLRHFFRNVPRAAKSDIAKDADKWHV